MGTHNAAFELANDITIGTATTESLTTIVDGLPKILTTDNTAAYTPTLDYHPATKLYVDDSTLVRDNTDVYTPTLDYHPATKVYVDTVGCGCVGITEAAEIQTALDAGNNLSISAGDYDISATIDISNVIGGIIRGSGRGEVLPVANQFRNNQTNLISDATLRAGTDPIIEFQGSDWSMEEIGVWGGSYYDISLDSATHTGGTHETVLTSAEGQSWATDSKEDYFVDNRTDGSTGVVLSNTAEALTLTVAGLTGGTLNTFTAGDKCFIYKTQRHDLGVLIKKGASIGTGKFHFRNFAMGWMATGVKYGETVSDTNCDLCNYENGRYYNIDVCNLSLHSFAMVSRWTCSIVSECGTFLKVQGGGKHVIDGINVVSGATTILHIANDENDDIATGNDRFEIRDVAIDTQGVDSKIVDMDYDTTGSPNDPQVNILCTGGHFPETAYSVPAWTIYQGTLLTINNYTRIQDDMIQWHQNPGEDRKDSTVIVDGCRLTGGVAADIFDIAGSTGICNAVVTNCVDVDGELIADYSAELDADLQLLLKLDEDPTTGAGVTFVDSSVNGNDGTENGVLTSQAGKFGNEIVFDDDLNNFIELDSIVTLTGAFTISYWITFANPVAASQVLSASTGNTRVLHSSASLMDFRGQSDEIATLSNTMGLVHSTRYHIVITRVSDGGAVAVYKDTVDVTYSTPTLSGEVHIKKIGKDQSGTWPHDGALDDIRIYDKVLSTSEILRLYTNPY